MTIDLPTRPAAKLDYELIFNRLPGLWLVLDPAFIIVAQNDEHARATLTMAREVIGKNVFDAFPENPDHAGADGLSVLRRSLLKVLKTREIDVMPLIRYDIKPDYGRYQERWWEVSNIPVLGKDGFVQWIINRAEDVTEWAHDPVARSGWSGAQSA